MAVSVVRFVFCWDIEWGMKSFFVPVSCTHRVSSGIIQLLRNCGYNCARVPENGMNVCVPAERMHLLYSLLPV